MKSFIILVPLFGLIVRRTGQTGTNGTPTEGDQTTLCNYTQKVTTRLKVPCNVTFEDGNVRSNQSNASQTHESNKTRKSSPGMKEPLKSSNSTASSPDTAMITAEVTISALVFIVGVTGNMLVILTVTSKRMRCVRNLLIGNLAIADLITLTVCLPLIVIRRFASWPFGPFICSYFFPLTDVVVSVSIWTICVITFDRFRAIVYPFAQKMSLKITIIVMVAIWLVSYLAVATPIIELMKIRPNDKTLICTPEWPSKIYQKGYRLMILIVLYIIPVCLIFFCFICIAFKISRNMRFARLTVRDSRSLATVQRRSRVVVMMFVIFITFTICLLPIHLILVVSVFNAPAVRWPTFLKLFRAALLILVANSAMNPIILYMLSSEFRRGFKEHCIFIALYMRMKERRTQASIIRSEELQRMTASAKLPSQPAQHNRKKYEALQLIDDHSNKKSSSKHEDVSKERSSESCKDSNANAHQQNAETII